MRSSGRTLGAKRRAASRVLTNSISAAGSSNDRLIQKHNTIETTTAQVRMTRVRVRRTASTAIIAKKINGGRYGASSAQRLWSLSSVNNAKSASGAHIATTKLGLRT